MKTFSRKGAHSCHGALEAVFAILVGGGLGHWVDSGTGTSPLFLLIGLTLGFCAFVLRMVRLARRLGTLEKEEGSRQESFQGGAWEDEDW